MNKEATIKAIESYVGDGFYAIPAGVRKDLNYNGVDLDDFRLIIDAAKETLAALVKSGKLKIISEGILNNLKSYIETSRRESDNLLSPDIGQANQALSAIYSYFEQIVAQGVPYLNLVDHMSYQSRVDEQEQVLAGLSQKIESDKKSSAAHKKAFSLTEKRSNDLLGKISSGVLSDNFKILSNGQWNYLLMAASMVIAVVSFGFLLARSNDLNGYLIQAFENDTLDYRVFIAKWSSMLPYLFLLSVGLLELRNRIRSRDIYIYRQSVAGSLDGYTTSLLNRADDMSTKQESDRARAMVIEFMIDSMMELTKSPFDKVEKHSMGLKIKDIGEATIQN